MSGTTQSQGNPPTAPKAVYEPPKLLAWGSIVEMTAGINGLINRDPDYYSFTNSST